MAKTIGVLTSAAPFSGSRHEAGFSLSTILQRAALFFQNQKDRDIERFIMERGGSFTDEVERALDRNLYKSSNWQ